MEQGHADLTTQDKVKKIPGVFAVRLLLPQEYGKGCYEGTEQPGRTAAIRRQQRK